MTNDIDLIKEKTGLTCGKVYIEGTDGSYSEEVTYAGEKVYDCKSKNFHIVPADINVRYALSSAYARKREVLIVALSAGDCEIPKTLKLLPILEVGTKAPDLGRNEIQLVSGAGKNGGKEPLEVFKYLSFYCNNKWFRINFMRFYVDGSEVNCVFNSLQYEMDLSGNGVNYAGKNFDLCYPSSSANGEEKTNSVGNVVFNPTISCYADSKTILNNFFDFVVKHKD